MSITCALFFPHANLFGSSHYWQARSRLAFSVFIHWFSKGLLLQLQCFSGRAQISFAASAFFPSNNTTTSWNYSDGSILKWLDEIPDLKSQKSSCIARLLMKNRQIGYFSYHRLYYFINSSVTINLMLMTMLTAKYLPPPNKALQRDDIWLLLLSSYRQQSRVCWAASGCAPVLGWDEFLMTLVGKLSHGVNNNRMQQRNDKKKENNEW